MSTSNTRIHLSALVALSTVSLDDVFEQTLKDERSGTNSVCIIENISPEVAERLKKTWHVPAQFFEKFNSNAQGPTIWEAVTSTEAKEEAHNAFKDLDPKQRSYPTQRSDLELRNIHKDFHIEGSLPHLVSHSGGGNVHRRLDHDPYYGWQVNSKISYYRVSNILYLFLVDKPMVMEKIHAKPSRLSLWVPYSANRGGLPIPQLYERTNFSAFDCLVSFFSHKWHFNVLFNLAIGDEALDPVTFSYVLAASLWRTNLRYLDEDIKEVAFKAIRRPSVKINDRLHERRHDLNTMRAEVLLAKSWILSDVEDALRDMNMLLFPKSEFEMLYTKSEELEHFLMDTFQLLMSSISVLDSQISIKHARRSTLLTQLAILYVPLSFVTGIFGMNVKEINGTGTPIWVAIVTLVVTILLTIILLLALRYFDDTSAIDGSGR